MKYFFLIFLFFTILINPLHARDRIRVVGSSTLYPFITVVAERFSKKYNVKTPIIEANGTGGGINLFCSGNNMDYPDIVNASRVIRRSEKEKCYKNDVKNFKQIKIGYDGIVLVNTISNKDYAFTLKDLFMALADKIPYKGKLIKNNNYKWNQVNESLPDTKILVYGPSYVSGTRDAFVELTLVNYCLHIPEYIKEYPEENLRKSACRLLRNDGAYVDMGENDNVIIHKIQSNLHAIGIIGYSYLQENSSKIKSIAINGVTANEKSILTEQYPLARSLYFIVNYDHIKEIPMIENFVKEVQSEDAIGKYGYLKLKGFIPAKIKQVM